MLKRFYRWVKGLFRKEKLFKYKYVSDVPDSLVKKTIYVIGEQGYYWQLLMKCPCGCNTILYMNLMEDQKPCWSYIINKSKIISIRPSVNRMVGCRSHFFIREGKLIWA